MKLLKGSLLLMLFASITFTSCIKEHTCIKGEGGIVSESIEVPAFTGIDLAEHARVILSQGPNQEVIVSGHHNIIDRLKKEVYGGVWKIDMRDHHCFGHYELTIFITVPDIESITISGSGDIEVGDFQEQGNLSLSISGSGEIDLESFEGCENLDLRISGSGNVLGNENFSSLENLDIVISGSGEYEGFPIQTDHCDITISGSGDCKVHVHETLNVNISGSGDVHYIGYPAITSSISGSGDIINAN